MSLVPCKACGHAIAVGALECTRCGKTDPSGENEREKKYKTRLRVFMGLSIVVACLAYLTLVQLPKIRNGGLLNYVTQPN
jgi:hypothetical protein